MSDDKKEEEEDSSEDKTKKVINFPPIDLTKMQNITTTAIDGLIDVQNKVPNILESLENITIDFAPKLDELRQATENIDFPQLTAGILDTLPQPIINSITTESKLLEQQNKTIDLLYEVLDEVKKNNKSQKAILNKIFKIIRELNEEQRLEHPFVDKLYQMALEWGLEKITEDEDD